MKEKDNSTRREFIAKTGIVTAGIALGAQTLTAAEYTRVKGANDKIRMGFIGIENRGSHMLN
jgi:hypothetical protein